MGGVYLGEGKNGGRTHSRPKAAPLCIPPPRGVFGSFPNTCFILLLDVRDRCPCSITVKLVSKSHTARVLD